MILIINVCKEELHYFEFVKPVEDIVVNAGMEYTVVHTDCLTKKHLDSADKVIICGTSLRDFEFENKDFSWITKYNKPIFGICAGFQAICSAYGFKTEKSTEIGLKKILFNKKISEKNKEFLGINGDLQAYCLHNNIIDESGKFNAEFDIYAKSISAISDNSEDTQKITKNITIHAIKKRDKPIYAVLFHPEVRNTILIENFLYI